MTSQNPVSLVTDFLTALARAELESVLMAVGDDIVYTNVGLPTIRGRKRFDAAIGAFIRGKVGFDVEFINIVSDDTGVVLTERIDEVSIGRFKIRFWVCGRFEVRDGQIAVWRDYFDVFDCSKAALRALIGLAIPRLNRRFVGVRQGVLR